MQKFLPVGIQDFYKMITGNFLYVDKTRHIYEMVRPPQGFYFLARPRRFGKSLFVSALECLFKGDRNLFKGLWIEQTDWQWKPHPIVKVDFSRISYNTSESLENDLELLIRQLASEHGIKFGQGSLPHCFSTLITDLAEKYDEDVVVLIDEYDKPIIEHLGKGESALGIAKESRDILKSFFGVLKAGDISHVLRFVFITGISKFARVSIFSDLNNLDDISMQDEYDAILGYTDDELVSFFSDHIDALAKKSGLGRQEITEKIRAWYNGYRFTDSETKVYNPFSVTKLFQKRKFQNYWFETATPSFLVNLIRERHYPVVDIESLRLPSELFTVYDLDRLRLEPLLFQTGYITIRHFDDILYHMDYPNQEVKTSFLAYLLDDMVRLEDVRLAGTYKLLHLYLRDGKADDFIKAVRSIFASIPYVQIAGQDEAYYHTVFYLMLSASGVTVQTEVLTSRGRMDIAAEFDDRVYIIELKCNHSSEKAVRQILDKKYYERYTETGREIYLMGINFDTEKRSIDDWQWGGLREYLDQYENV